MGPTPVLIILGEPLQITSNPSTCFSLFLDPSVCFFSFIRSTSPFLSFCVFLSKQYMIMCRIRWSCPCLPAFINSYLPQLTRLIFSRSLLRRMFFLSHARYVVVYIFVPSVFVCADVSCFLRCICLFCVPPWRRCPSLATFLVRSFRICLRSLLFFPTVFSVWFDLAPRIL